MITDKQKQDLERKRYLIQDIDNMIIQLNELLILQHRNYEPYNEKQTKQAIRALLNIRGFKSIKSIVGTDQHWTTVIGLTEDQ